jgi:uncharacterized protein DUF6497
MTRLVKYETVATPDQPQAYPKRVTRIERKHCRAVFTLVLGLFGLVPVLISAEPVPVQVPSGQEITLNEVLLDDAPGTLWIRFRFVAPGISRSLGSVTYEVAARDMDDLCSEVAVPYLDQHALEPSRVVISLADRPVPFGSQDPDATQFFEAYRLEVGRCILEEF